MSDYFVHPTAEVADDARIGAGTKLWNEVQVRPGASVGAECIIGKGVYIDFDVSLGDRCKVQNYSCLYHGVTLEDGVFIGPNVVFTNDSHPRAIGPDGALKGDADWKVGHSLVRYGASIGSGAVILPGVTIGRWALVAAGAVVTKDVLDHGLVAGVPASHVGWACLCARPLDDGLTCPGCGSSFRRSESGLVASRVSS